MNTKNLIVILVVLTGSACAGSLCPSADLTRDCRVDLADLAVMAAQWLTGITPAPWPDDMVFVPAGAFAYQNAGPEGYVFVDDFAIGKYEVTNYEYCEFLNHMSLIYNDNQHWAPSQQITRYLHSLLNRYIYSVKPDREDYPVWYVNYYDAVAFADWKSWLEGRSYRLPTGQEWEKAAGWDPDLRKLWTYGFQQDTIDTTWCLYKAGMGAPDMLPVGSFNGTGGKKDAKSFYGCYDMSGSVNEWVDLGPPTWLGGSYSDGALNCSVTYRLAWASLSGRYKPVGFRLVLDL